MNDELDLRLHRAKAAYGALGPDDAALARMLAAIEAPPAAPVVSASGGHKWLHLVGVGAGVLGASALLWRLLAAPAVPVAPSSAPAVTAEPQATQEFAPEAETEHAEQPTIAPPRATTVRPRVRDEPADALAELVLLSRARRVLDIDPARALALTDQHKQTFAQGALGEERELLAIEALARLGRESALQKRVHQFLRSHARSVHRARVLEIAASSAKEPGKTAPSGHER